MILARQLAHLVIQLAGTLRTMALQSRTVFGSPPTSAHEAQEVLDSLVMTWAHDIETGRPVYVLAPI